MADHPDVEIIKRGHKAFNDRDFDALKECFTEDVRWHTPGHSPMAGTVVGRDALMSEFFEAQRDRPVRVEAHDVLANGEHLVSIDTLHVEAGGETKSFDAVEVCHTRDGKISERWALVTDQQGLDETLAQLMSG